VIKDYALGEAFVRSVRRSSGRRSRLAVEECGEMEKERSESGKEGMAGDDRTTDRERKPRHDRSVEEGRQWSVRRVLPQSGASARSRKEG
jgi:hypothetical protein